MIKSNKSGRIIESLPNSQFKVHVDGTPDDVTIRCVVSGKMRMANIYLNLNDKVDILHTPDMGAIGRIVWKQR